MGPNFKAPKSTDGRKERLLSLPAPLSLYCLCAIVHVCKHLCVHKHVHRCKSMCTQVFTNVSMYHTHLFAPYASVCPHVCMFMLLLHISAEPSSCSVLSQI